MARTAKTSYSEDSIERYAGLAGIRKKPTVYVGPMDNNGLWTIFREPADNGVDQALAGRNSMVHLVVDSEPNTYWVLDAGEGIPVGLKVFEDERGKKEKMSTLFVVTGLTHGGGNFSGDNISRGTHGIGIKATNALSKSFIVWTFREGQWWCISYASGKIVKDVHKSSAPKLPHGLKATMGTVVKFCPELELFAKSSRVVVSDIVEWCKLTSYLVQGLKVCYTNSKGKTSTMLSKRGPIEFIEARTEELKCTSHGKPFIFNSKEVDIAVSFSDADGGDFVYAYTNGLRNKDGGEHLRAFYEALAKSLIPHRPKGRAVKGRAPAASYTPTDLREGILGLVNYKISAPMFNNQTKDKLLDSRVYDVAYAQLFDELSTFWDKNKSMAKEVIRRATELRSRTSDFLKDKNLIKNVKTAGRGLSAKLADVGNSKTPFIDRELFLVEGDSAGGTAKVARHRNFQATFSLKGKPLNVMETTKDKVNKNKEIAGIFAAIGLDMGHANPISKIRFGSIIFLADPDVDGSHINTLLMTLFWKYLPELYREGRIYLLLAPEYMAKVKGKVFFASSVKLLYKRCGTDKVDVRHIKGWGELEAEDMQPIAFDKGSRRLARILPPSDKAGVLQFEALMGKKSLYRQQLLGVVTSGAVDVVEGEE
jgi:DNA gyrase/topoisomerase IV subunit B